MQQPYSTYLSPNFEPNCDMCKSQVHAKHTVTNSQIVHHGVISSPSKIVSQRIIPTPSQIQPLPVQRSPIPASPVTQQYQRPSQIINYTQPTYQERQVSNLSQVTHVHNVDHVPVVHELHHVQRNVSVVSVDEIEGPWRSKVLKLERQMLELELLVRKGAAPRLETKQVVVEDNAKIKALQDEIDQLEKLLSELDQERDQLQQELYDLEDQLNNEEASTAATAQFDRDYAAIKKKFQDLNSRYHDTKSEYDLKEAELDSLKKRKIVTTTETVRTTGGTSSVRKSGGGGETAGGASQYSTSQFKTGGRDVARQLTGAGDSQRGSMYRGN